MALEGREGEAGKKRGREGAGAGGRALRRAWRSSAQPGSMGELCSFTFKFRLSRRVKLGNGSALASTSPSPPCSLVSQLFPLLEWKIPTPQCLQNQHSHLSTLLTPQNLHPSPSTSSDHSSHHLDGRWNSSSFSSVKSQNILSWNHRVQLLALPPASHLVLFRCSPDDLQTLFRL